MTSLSILVSGAAVGLCIAAPIGPMAVLCINRTLTAGIKAGISTGAGASTVHVAYACLILIGFQQIGPVLAANRAVMDLASAALMLLFAWRILRRQLSGSSGADAGSVVRNYGSAVAFNCLNPMLLVLLVGAIGTIVGPEPAVGRAVSALLLGVFLGSAGWWIVLSFATFALRGRLGLGVLRGINRLSAAGMVGFALLSLSRTFPSW
jgi:threonine/homoserine/homoserine lactone efflux protein